MKKYRTNIYIDGYNFYYLAVKGTPYKWLDFKSLFEKLLGEKNTISEIKYFTARASGKGDSQRPIRQNAYLRALKQHIPEISIYYGQFRSHEVNMPLAKPSKRYKFARVIKREEKGSDVNLAVHLLNDAWLNKYDCAVVVSNDSDLVEAIRIVREDRKKLIGWTIYDPPNSPEYRPSKELQKQAHFIKNLKQNVLRDSQLPDKIPGTKIYKPAIW